MTSLSRVVATAGGLFLAPICSMADSSSSPQEPTTQELMRALEERDKMIADLLKRVEALERANATATATESPETVGIKASPSDIPDHVPPAQASSDKEPVPEQKGGQQEPTEEDVPQVEDQRDDAEADADLAARALERTLVERGALLLPVWGVEIAPSVTYAHEATDAFVLFPDERIGTRTRNDTVDTALTLRLGLPWDSQVEVSAPLSYVREEEVSDSTRQADDDFGLGDVRLTVSHQLLREDGSLPDLLVSASWKTTTGSNPFDMGRGTAALGTGFDEITGTLTAVKSHDPLVFFGSVWYTEALAGETAIGRVDPGSLWGLTFGTVLAVSPETSLNFSISPQFRDELSLDGEEVAGTDQTTAVLQVGAAVLLTPRTLLNVTAGVGLTEDSPDFQIGVSLPIRFSF